MRTRSASTTPPQLSIAQFGSKTVKSVFLLIERVWRHAKGHVPVPGWRSTAQHDFTSRILRRALNTRNLLLIFWLVVLFWGEHSTFSGNISSCDWRKWEKWPPGARPHHLIFVADPQLVDPHTYPGRPWPLSSLTVSYSDLFLKRGFTHMQRILYPDTVVFLGDLFDGGREWSTLHSTSPENRWRKYGEDFWFREYDRFGRIFFQTWTKSGMQPRLGMPGRKLIASLPGNHDLGFAAGVQEPVKDRFDAYFGDGNRVDVIGNHTFVSVDTASYSAMASEDSSIDSRIWTPSKEFLDRAQDEKDRAVARELRLQNGLPEIHRFKHIDSDVTKDPGIDLPDEDFAEFPTILLSHIPLYRQEGMPCGPLREHSPPSPEHWPTVRDLEVPAHEPVYDQDNAIKIAAGYQYQNVLYPKVTQQILRKVGHVQAAFSGDDHDYCEVVHKSYPSAGAGIREITVKSVSMAMGVRRPGFVMLSLWNPVRPNGDPIFVDDEGWKSGKTMQTHLCLLPDTIGTILHYLAALVLSITILAVRAIYVTRSGRSQDYEALPTSRCKIDEVEANLGSEASLNSATAAPGNGHVSARSSLARLAGVSSPKYGYSLPMHRLQQLPGEKVSGRTGKLKDEDDGPVNKISMPAWRRRRRHPARALFEFAWSMAYVAVPVLIWWTWLLRNV